jgi:acyl dehydratase
MSTASTSEPVEGAEAEPRRYGPLAQPDFVRYAGASGDFNPIHFNEEFARDAGFPSVFSQGMLQAGVLASYVTDWLGAENVRRFRVQFREQVWPGDVLECSATVVRRYEERGETRVDLEVRCARIPEASDDHAGLAITGEATFVV